eukprot:scaffold25406_cov117-Cylindrotheca_fusiformis.AAC.3
MWFNISAVNMYDERAFATDPDHDVLLLKHPEILLYITTHFSDQHIRYFRCCWPKLIAESTLISHAHILIMASNETTVPQEDLTYLSDLFSRNPSYQFKVLPREDWQTRCAKYQNEAVRGNNPLKTPVNYKQCVANLGVQVGFQHGWVFSTPNNSSSFDWMIRINPDVLIRKSSWLLQTMSNRKSDHPFFLILPFPKWTLRLQSSIMNERLIANSNSCWKTILPIDFFQMSTPVKDLVVSEEHLHLFTTSMIVASPIQTAVPNCIATP